jgi:hypothetical protein
LVNGAVTFATAPFTLLPFSPCIVVAGWLESATMRTRSPSRLVASAAFLLASTFALTMVDLPVLAQEEEIPESVLVTGSLIRGVVPPGQATPINDSIRFYPAPPPPDPLACAMPTPSASAVVLLVGTNEADALSTTAIGSQDVSVGTAAIVIEPGREPIYLVVSSAQPIIWRVSGAIERLERLVLTSSRNSPDGARLDQPPVVGATGVPARKITFLKRIDCLRDFNEARSSASAADKVMHETGRAPTVIADYEVAEFSIPSGKVRKNRKATGLVFIQGQGSLTIKGNAGNVVIQTGDIETVEHDLRSYHPGGVIEVNPRNVVATYPAERYGLLPEQAGLVQHMKSGAVRKNQAHAEFVITRKIRLPAELGGYTFILPRGVPEPDGNVRRSAVVSEETGQPIAGSVAPNFFQLAPPNTVACAMPPASEPAKVVLLGANVSDALSTTTIESQDIVVGTTSIKIEPGREPLYLVASSLSPIIWRVSGAVDRLERLVLTGNATGYNFSPQEERPSVGVTGVPAEKVTFLGRMDCMRSFSEVPSLASVRATAVVTREAGKAPAIVAADSQAAEFSVPSGRIRANPIADGPQIVVDRGADRPIVRGGKAVIIENGRAGTLERDLFTYHPGGVFDIDPNGVIASRPVERYVVMPRQAGLLQLLRSGALKQNSAGDLLITRKIRLPAGLYGEHAASFILLRDVPEPDGNLGHSRLVAEETREPSTR